MGSVILSKPAPWRVSPWAEHWTELLWLGSCSIARVERTNQGGFAFLPEDFCVYIPVNISDYVLKTESKKNY